MSQIQTDSAVSTSWENIAVSGGLGRDALVRLMTHIEKIKNLDHSQQKIYADDALLTISQRPYYLKMRADLATGFLLKRLIDINQRLKNEPENPDLQDYRLCAGKLGSDEKNDLITQMARKWKAPHSYSTGKKDLARENLPQHVVGLFKEKTEATTEDALKNFLTCFADSFTDIRYTRKKRIEDFKAGGKEACDHIFGHLYRYLMPVATYKVGENNAYDLVADTLLKVWNKRESFSSAKHLYLFAYKHLGFKVVDSRMDQERENKHYTAYAHEISESIFDPPVLEAIEEREKQTFLHDTLHQGIAQLPPQRSALMTLFAQGKKADEVANELGITYQTVSNTKATATESLRHYFVERHKLVHAMCS